MVDTRFPVSVHIMTALAARRPELMSSEQLAVSVKTNASFIRKLVVSLSSAGLVESVRGKTGGVRLVKSPEEITLAQIYKAVTNNCLMAVPDKKPNKQCSISCSMGDVLGKISDDIEENTIHFLSQKNLGEILEHVSR